MTLPTGRIYTWAALIPAIISVAIVGLLGYWALDTSPPIVNVEQRFLHWDEKQPNLFWIERKGERVRYCPGEVHRWLIGQSVITLPVDELQDEKHSPTGAFSSRVPILVPEWVPHVDAYRVRIHYSCNPLQRWFPLRIAVPDAEIPPRDSRRSRHIPTPDKTGLLKFGALL